MTEMSTVIRYAPRIVNTIEIDAVELIFMPLHEAENPILSDKRSYKLYNEIFHYCRSRKNPSSREYINTFYKRLFINVVE